ncbi:MAG TPA: hypothetical protein DIU15_18060, partial [Deltaproteobacteria bacterium]|nr:hypothetical protein [Deltaproteobacteria bacterium]
GVDNNCDGTVDEDSAVDAVPWFLDGDGDGYGDGSEMELACDAPAGYVADGTDCRDDDASLFPELDGTCPHGLDCLAIVGTAVDVGTGLYTLDPDGSRSGEDPFSAWCDMETDGGGWSLVMRCVDSYIDYSDALWENTSLLDENNYDFGAEGCSKYAAYNAVSFQELRTSYPDDLSNDFVEDLGADQASALALFSGDGFEISTSFQSYFNGMVDPFSQEWGCAWYRSYGINQADYLGIVGLPGGFYCDWNGGARWGQRVNASHGFSGNHTGQGWGAYSTVGFQWSWEISQLMWVR